jgi:hypothetical protein
VTKSWTTDEELFRVVQRELFTCVVGDVADVGGRRKDPKAKGSGVRMDIALLLRHREAVFGPRHMKDSTSS